MPSLQIPKTQKIPASDSHKLSCKYLERSSIQVDTERRPKDSRHKRLTEMSTNLMKKVRLLVERKQRQVFDFQNQFTTTHYNHLTIS